MIAVTKNHALIDYICHKFLNKDIWMYFRGSWIINMQNFVYNFLWGEGPSDYQKVFLEICTPGYFIFKEVATYTLFQFFGEENMIFNTE